MEGPVYEASTGGSFKGLIYRGFQRFITLNTGHHKVRKHWKFDGVSVAVVAENGLDIFAHRLDQRRAFRRKQLGKGGYRRCRAGDGLSLIHI